MFGTDRRALVAQPMSEWSEQQVQEWITLIGLAADEMELVRKAMAEDDADGEDLQVMTGAFEDSGTAKPLQKLLKRCQDSHAKSKHHSGSS